MSHTTYGMPAAFPTVAAVFTVSPEYVRLPAPGEHDSLFGLTRSYLNLLILPSEENDFSPPVRSSVIRQPNAKTGVRLVNVSSLRDYLIGQTGGRSGNHVQSSSASTIAEGKAAVEFLRLPKSKERDPLFGLSRSFLNELILPCEKNSYRPPVRSHVLRRRGYRTGIRLISVDSLRDYVKAHEEAVESQLKFRHGSEDQNFEI